MEARLTDLWLGNLERVDTRDEASMSACRQRVRAAAKAIDMPEVKAERLVLAASELVANQLAHARRGETVVRRIERDGVSGIEVIAADEGDGIADVPAALASGSDIGDSLGIGIGAIFRNAEEIDVDIRIGEGTCFWARSFAASVPPRPQIAIYGRACPGERAMGDAAVFVRSEDALMVAVIDGLGHGPAAREPAMMAARISMDRSNASPGEVIDACQAALAGTRGAVMTTLRIDDRAMEIEHAAIGNICTRICEPRGSRTLAGRGGVVGAPPRRPAKAERLPLGRGNVVMAFSDGLKSAANLSGELTLMRQHPLVGAHHLVHRYFRDRDDAIAVVVRL